MKNKITDLSIWEEIIFEGREKHLFFLEWMLIAVCLGFILLEIIPQELLVTHIFEK